MEVNGTSLNILDNEKSIIIPHSFEEGKGLQFLIEMRTNGDKVMSVVLKSLEITLDLDKLGFLGSYSILDAKCYPKQKIISDLPFISCNVCVLNSFIKLL